MNKNAKKAAISSALNQLKEAPMKVGHLDRVAQSLVDPQGAPMVFPQRTPGRLGCATFPLVRQIRSPSGASATPDVGIIVRPSLEKPLLISRPDLVPYSNSVVSGGAWANGNSVVMAGVAPCNVAAETIDGITSLPLRSDAVGGQLTVAFSADKGEHLYYVEFMEYDGSWSVKLAWTVKPGVTEYTNSTPYTNTNSRYAFRFTDLRADSQSDITIFYTLTPTAGNFSCGPSSYDEAVMDLHLPDWTSLLTDSKRARVVACDVLVTYEGSSLENAGSIAVANVDDDYIIPEGATIYETMASRPFDKYRGRLASEGSSEGGAHWHYVPTDEDQASASHNSIPPKGIIGISGLQPDQVVRVECHFLLNFYSEKPQYKMEFPPPITGLSPLLWTLRTEVPLVSSNDMHSIVKALRKTGKKGASGALSMATDPRVLKTLGMMAALL